MAMTIHVDIVSAETELYSGLAEMVFVPGKMGELGIAPRHTPLVTTLKPGLVRLELPDNKEASFFVSGGILEIQPHVVTILSDSASRTEDMDEAAVLKAKEDAEHAFENLSDDINFDHYQQQMVEARAKYEALQKLRGRSGRS
ncbi:MAG: F-type H+-transporting ATPase subunit epsilon [Gammaproteobacteria bacterium]|jgi:F-type H+-transporting ATPase subunit epsilon